MKPLDELKRTAWAANGMTTMAERLALLYLVNKLEPGSNIVEVGTNKAGTSSMLCEVSEECNVYTIDIVDHIEDTFKKPDNLTLYNGTAESFVKEKLDFNVDVLFIDADHAFYGAMMDYVSFAPHLKKGTPVIFHDCDGLHPGVMVACKSLADGNNLSDFELYRSTLCTVFTGKADLDIAAFISNIDKFRKDTDDWFPCGHGFQPLKGENLAYYPNRKLEVFPPMTLPDSHIERMESIFDSRGKSGGPVFIGKGGRGKAIATLVDLDPETFIDSAAATDESKDHVVCSSMSTEIFRALIREKNFDPERCIEGLDFFRYGCFRDIVDNKGKRLLGLFENSMARQFVSYLSGCDAGEVKRVYQLGIFNCFIRL